MSMKAVPMAQERAEHALEIPEPRAALLQSELAEALFSSVKAEVDRHEPDVATQKGRDQIRSLAARVTKVKTRIDATRKEMTEEWRQKTAEVNAAGMALQGRFAELADQARKPLTDWEEKEKVRQEMVDKMISSLRMAAVVNFNATAAEIEAKLKECRNWHFDPEDFRDQLETAEMERGLAVKALEGALAGIRRAEAERAELERLRAEAEAREAEARRLEEARLAEEQRLAAEIAEAERMARIEAEAAERARLQAEAAAKAEIEKVEREKREALEAAEREAREAREAAERKREEAEAAAAAERVRVQRAHQEALAAEKQRADELERAARAERDRLAAEEAERVRRENNERHRQSVMSSAKKAIMSCGADEETARKIVLAIKAREIPHVSILF